MARPLSERIAEGGDKRARRDVQNPYEPIPTEPIGEPIIDLTEPEYKMYVMFRDKQLLKGVAFASDNYSLCVLSKLAARELTDDLSASERQEMYRYLCAFGLMPSARRNVVQRDENGNPNAGFSGLFNGKPDLKLIKEDKVQI